MFFAVKIEVLQSINVQIEVLQSINVKIEVLESINVKIEVLQSINVKIFLNLIALLFCTHQCSHLWCIPSFSVPARRSLPAVG